MEAVYAPEDELIPEPIPITVIVLIARWAVPPRVGRGSVLESDHQMFLFSPADLKQAALKLIQSMRGVWCYLLQVVIGIDL